MRAFAHRPPLQSLIINPGTGLPAAMRCQKIIKQNEDVETLYNISFSFFSCLCFVKKGCLKSPHGWVLLLPLETLLFLSPPLCALRPAAASTSATSIHPPSGVQNTTKKVF